MLNVKCANGRMEFCADGDVEEIAHDLLALCNGVLHKMAVVDAAEALIARVWIAKNLYLTAEDVTLDG